MSSPHRAEFHFDADDAAWLVTFPAYPGCQTYGSTLDEAREHAAEALAVWLDVESVVLDEHVQPHAASAG